MRWIFTSALLITLMTGCANTKAEVTETSQAICALIAADLPTRSRMDTDLTQSAIQKLYATFEAVCPDHAHLIP